MRTDVAGPRLGSLAIERSPGDEAGAPSCCGMHPYGKDQETTQSQVLTTMPATMAA
jgi:hypothetical protein